ncbi:MAG: Bug family tripartite tricarboxylate transporter substrate binding protein [Burkholderiaceae bacterium]
MLSRSLAIITACACAAFAAAGHAQTYPSKPVKIVVPYAAGQGTDIVARYFAEQLTRSLGQSFVVENRAGAGGNIGTQLVAKSPADGYTLMMGTNATHAANSVLYDNPGFDPQADFEPVALVGILPLVFVSSVTSPVDSIQKLVAVARAKPGAVNFAVTTTTSRSAYELLKQQAQATFAPVPYKGAAQAASDIIGNQIEYTVDTITSLRPYVESGKLKALGVTSASSTRLMPGIASVAEQGVPGYEISGWNVVFAPKGTPPAAIRVLASELGKLMAMPETQAKLLQLGVDPLVKTGDDLAAFMNVERDKWGKLIRAANLKAQ